MLNVIVTGRLASCVTGFPSLHKHGCILELRLGLERYDSWVGMPDHSVMYVDSLEQAYDVLIKLAKQCGDLWSGPSVRTLQRKRRESAGGKGSNSTL